MRCDLLVANRAERRFLRRVSIVHQRANFLDESGRDHRVEAAINRLVEFFPIDLDTHGQRVVAAEVGESMPPMMRRNWLAGQFEDLERSNYSVPVVDADSVRSRGI